MMSAALRNSLSGFLKVFVGAGLVTQPQVAGLVRGFATLIVFWWVQPPLSPACGHEVPLSMTMLDHDVPPLMMMIDVPVFLFSAPAFLSMPSAF